MGWRGVVLRAGRKPSHFGLPTARFLVDARGQSVPALDVDLSDPKHAGYGAVARVLSQPNTILRAAAKSIDAPVSAWLSAFDDDAHTAIEALELARRLRARLSWAEPIRRGVDGGPGLQGDGIYLEVRLDVL